MDPTANLSEQLQLAEAMLDDYYEDGGNGIDQDDAARLADLVQSLNAWISSGGVLPVRWRRGSELPSVGGYYTVCIPYSEKPTVWHPTEKEGTFSVLQRGAFRTEQEAHVWANEKLEGQPYTVVLVSGIEMPSYEEA